MASSARIDELKKKFDENPRRYFAPLANEFRKAGDIDQAIMICEEFLPQQPGHMSGHIVYGQALFEAGRMPEARTVFETALGLDPENLIALRHLGDIARGQGDDSAARGWYVRVLDADPRNEEIQTLIASLESEAQGAEPVANSADTVIVEAAGVERAPDDADALGAMLFTPPPPPAPPLYAPLEEELIDGFSLDGLETTPETSALMPSVSPQAAEGFEATEFAPPAERMPEATDLDDTFESGVPSFSVPSEPVASLAGWEDSHSAVTSSADTSASDDVTEFTPLEFDAGLVLPPHGDPDYHAPPPIPDSTPANTDASEPDLLDFEMPVSAPLAAAWVEEEVGAPQDTESVDAGADEMPQESSAAVEVTEEIPVVSTAGPADDSAGDVPMEELPPAVLAGEAVIMDAAEHEALEGAEPPAPETAQDEVAAELPVANQPFVTETMAELYLAQGFRDQALAVYEQLLAADPTDERLTGLVASLSADRVAADEGPTAREFFARIAARRPSHRAEAAVPPADDDFASSRGEASLNTVPAPQLETEQVVAPEPERDVQAVAPAIARVAATQTPSGSIDALFGNRTPGKSEDSAAAALAQAFGGSGPEESPAISGRPARAATAELSLDSVFRDGPARPPRTSQSFSFDQFFAEGAATTQGERASGPRNSAEMPIPGEPPAERSADDIDQFNSWLQGLKPR